MPASFIEAVDNIVKADLLNWRDMWFHCLLWSTAAVAVGLLLEGPELYFEIRHIWLDKRDRRMFFVVASHEIAARWKVLAFVGWILIAIGVAGEGIFEAMVSRADGQVQAFNDILLVATQKEAGAAVESAKTAHHEADAVKTEADSIQKRLEVAWEQLSTLETDVIAQGPRWRLLEKSKPDLAKKLSRFEGQKVDLFVCGPPQAAHEDREMMSTWGRIDDTLNREGAKWTVLNGGLRFWNTEPLSCEGIHIFVNAHAPKRTMEAAKELSDGLVRTLPPSVDTMLRIIDPDWALSMIRQGSESENAPWSLPAKYPDLISVFIARHPQTEPIKKRKNRK